MKQYFIAAVKGKELIAREEYAYFMSFVLL
jgi:hypothetical protein